MEEHNIAVDELNAIVDLPVWKLNLAIGKAVRGENTDLTEKGWTVAEEQEKAKVRALGGSDSVRVIPSHDVLSLFHSGVLTLSEDPRKQDHVEDFLAKNGFTRDMLKPQIP